MGRNKLPDGKKRVRIFGRVNPATVDFFRSLNAENDGRAMDKTVQLVRSMQTALGFWEGVGYVVAEAQPLHTSFPTVGKN